MISNIPPYTPILFILTICFTLVIVFWILRDANNKSISKKAHWIILGMIIWLLFQALVTIRGLYSGYLDSIPPNILSFGVIPNVLFILTLFLSSKGKDFIDVLSLNKITYLSLARIPIEFVLLSLFMHDKLPKSMTFEGVNFDIIMGLTAPFVIYFGFIKNKLSWRSILIWNVFGIGLLLSVVLIGLFSAPFPFQKLAFEQPNIALLYFPFSWLPTFIVPLVILGHFISIRQLLLKRDAALLT